MTALARAWRYWVALLSRREDARGLALFRIAIGLALLYSLLSVLAAGLVGFFWVHVDHGGFEQLGRGNWLVSWLGGTTPGVVYSLFAAALCGALAVTVGLGGRPAILSTVLAYHALVTINRNTNGGYDFMLINALWLLLCSQAMSTWSVSCRVRTGRWHSGVTIPAWPRYLAVLQLIVIYTTTGLHKIAMDWNSEDGFSALYRVLQDPLWRRFELAWLAWVYPATQFMTAFIAYWEVAALLLLFVYYARDTRARGGRLRGLCVRRDPRVFYAAIGVCLHLGIAVTMSVGPFSWVSLAFYPCLFHPDEILAAWRRLARRSRARRAP